MVLPLIVGGYLANKRSNETGIPAISYASPAIGGGAELAKLMDDRAVEKQKQLMAEQQRIREESYNRMIAQSRQEREKDLAAGRARGEELFGKTFYSQSRDERSGDIADVLARRKEALSGLSSEENTAARESMALNLGRQQQGALRNLRASQATAGLTGGVAAAQNQQLLNQGAQQRADVERQLFLENIAQKQNALNAYEGSTRSAETEEIGRYGSRQVGKLGSELGMAQLGTAERAGVAQQALGEAQLSAAQQQGGGNKMSNMLDPLGMRGQGGIGGGK